MENEVTAVWRYGCRATKSRTHQMHPDSVLLDTAYAVKLLQLV